MPGLPEALRYDRIREGLIAPDYSLLQDVLPTETLPGQDLEIVSLRETGNRLLGVADALPLTGHQGTFAYIYGALTHTLADVVDGRPEVAHLPRITCPDDLTKQAAYFAETYFSPLRQYVDYLRAGEVDDADLQQKIAGQIAPHWLASFTNPAAQFHPPVIQFMADGLSNHILGDLPPSLIRSGVSPEYMRRGGDYDNVNVHIGYVTMMKATELVEGRRRMVDAAVRPVPPAISVMRAMAKRRYHRLQRADSQAEYDTIVVEGTQLAARVSAMTATYGTYALRAFGAMAGVPRQERRQALPDDGA